MIQALRESQPQGASGEAFPELRRQVEVGGGLQREGAATSQRWSWGLRVIKVWPKNPHFELPKFHVKGRFLCPT